MMNTVDAVDHTQVNYLDLDKSLKADSFTENGFKIIFFLFRKPENAYAYIPFNSFHARHTFGVDSGRAITALDS
jgi:hypothetical protein